MGRQSKEKPQGKLIIRKKRINAKGEVPIYVSYFIKGKTIERSTDMFIPPTQWDEKGQKVVGHKDSPRLNNKLAAIKRGYDEAIEQYDGLLTAEVLRKLLDGEAVEGRPNPKKTDFVQYAMDYNQRRYDISKIGYSTFYNAKLYLEKFKNYMEKKAVIYSRVSSTGDRQDTSRQIRDLEILAKQRNLKIEKTYEEHVSGAKKTQDRPVLKRMPRLRNQTRSYRKSMQE